VESKVNYTVVGLFVILLTAALIVGSLWLSAGEDSKSYTLYQTFMNESVSGLNVQAPVKYNGVTVGSVKDVELVPHNLQQVSLILSIRSDVPVTESAIASLKAQGITGLMYVNLRALEEKSTPLKKKPGQQYPVIKSEPSLFVQLDQVLRNVTKDVKSVADSITKVFSEKNQQALSRTFQHIDKFTQLLSNNSEALDKSIKAMEGVLMNAEKASKDLPQLMDNISESTVALKSTLIQSESTFQSINQNVLPQVTLTLDRLNTMLNNLSGLTGELQENPSILVRGRRPTAPGPGE